MISQSIIEDPANAFCPVIDWEVLANANAEIERFLSDWNAGMYPQSIEKIRESIVLLAYFEGAVFSGIRHPLLNLITSPRGVSYLALSEKLPAFQVKMNRGIDKIRVQRLREIEMENMQPLTDVELPF